MDQQPPPKTLRNRRASRTHVKSGCRTCKIRKVKCDEGRPACDRCCSTGRVCDGYGIWGGGNSSHVQFSTTPKECNNCTLYQHVTIGVISTEEHGYFDWFVRRTAPKLPGTFDSAFWNTLVVQASSVEPAVFHAAVALSAFHKNMIPSNRDLEEKQSYLEEHEQFMLRQYSKAIHQLQPHFSTKDKASVRVTLVTCALFICLEFLRGYYKTANSHLQNGLKLLGVFNALSTTEEASDIKLVPCHELVDDWIVETFSRLHVQTRLLGQSSGHLYSALCIPSFELSTLDMQSPNQARQLLDQILFRIVRLTELRRLKRGSHSEECLPELLDSQQLVKTDLRSWFNSFESYKARIQNRKDSLEEFAGRLLILHYTMAEIMADACLAVSESIYDSHAYNFLSIMAQALEIWEKISTASSFHVVSLQHPDMSTSISDIGWISPLFFTALKCRIHRVRIQAVKLLRSIPHKEGIWDSILTSSIAQKVIEIEEQGIYKDYCLADNFPLHSMPEDEDLLLPELPDSQRIEEIQITLPDDPLGKIGLTCSRTQSNGNLEVIVREYDIPTQYWRDAA